MSKLDLAKEKIAYLKLWFTIVAAAAITLIGWLLTNFLSAHWLLSLAAILALLVIDFIGYAIHARIETKISGVTARVISGVASHIQVEETEALHVSRIALMVRGYLRSECVKELLSQAQDSSLTHSTLQLRATMSAIRHPCLIMGQCPSNFEGRNTRASRSYDNDNNDNDHFDGYRFALRRRFLRLSRPRRRAQGRVSPCRPIESKRISLRDHRT